MRKSSPMCDDSPSLLSVFEDVPSHKVGGGKAIIFLSHRGLLHDVITDGQVFSCCRWIREQMWEPVYRPLQAVQMEGASREARGEMKVVGSLTRAGSW